MFQRDARVRYSEVDQNGNLTIVALVNYLQDTAAFHSDSVGYGLSYLAGVKQGWFITNWQLDIPALPKYGEKIRLSTWAYEMRGILSKRNFTIENEAGERLVAANSLWVRMNLATGRPEHISKEEIAAYGPGEPLPGDWGGRKIPLFADDTFTSVGQTEVMPIHLDTNRHMNNAYYIEIARDALPKGKKIFGIRVEYKKPAELGNQIDIQLSVEEQTSQVLLKDDEGKLFSVIEFRTN